MDNESQEIYLSDQASYDNAYPFPSQNQNQEQKQQKQNIKETFDEPQHLENKFTLPKINIAHKFSQDSLMHLQMRRFAKLVQPRQKAKYRQNQNQKQKQYNNSNLAHQTYSLAAQNYKISNQQNQIKNTTSLAKQKKKQNFRHINPRVYQMPKQHYNGQLTALPKLTKISSISLFLPELQSSKVLNDYRIISHVGKGCFSVVSAAVNKTNNKKFAIKTYNRIDQLDQIRIKGIQSQVQNLFNLHHQNVIQLKHAIKDGRKIQLIMENGGQQSLSGLLRKYLSFSQQIAKKYFRQIAQAVAYCHSQNVCHRDIKLQNILVDENDKIKIIDFGFSLKCNNRMRLTSFCGTPPYMSPELASRSPYNGQSSDIWALGVLLYLMLTGKFPFKAGNQKQLYRIIQQGKYKYTNQQQILSPQVKQLLEDMLRVDQTKRISAKQVVNCKWLNNQIKLV